MKNYYWEIEFHYPGNIRSTVDSTILSEEQFRGDIKDVTDPESFFVDSFVDEQMSDADLSIHDIIERYNLCKVVSKVWIIPDGENPKTWVSENVAWEDPDIVQEAWAEDLIRQRYGDSAFDEE